MISAFQHKDLHFEYPEGLTATQPSDSSRVMLCQGDRSPREVSIPQLLDLFRPGDLLVINETKVLKRRVFAGKLEILFINEIEPQVWEVLFPVRGLTAGSSIELPDGFVMTLIEKSRPQKVRISQSLTEEYFERHGEIPLPPYIQKQRSQRHTLNEDSLWYQTAWAKHKGSLAAPTASLHFKNHHLEVLRERGVEIQTLTLHVGLGTFLPIQGTIETHRMHKEYAQISQKTWEQVKKTKKQGHRVWAMGTTVTRALESVPRGLLRENAQGDFVGDTDLFITPGFKFQVVDVLMTNFHQPESTLLALVFSFAGVEQVKGAYAWAIERHFRLFSYGDLTVWLKDKN